MVRSVLLLFACVLLLGPAHPVGAQDMQEPQVVRVDPVVRDGWVHVDADLEFSLPGELRNVAEKGVPLYFTADLEIVSRRWWWFDKVIADERQTWRLTYNALTRQWRLKTGELSLPESTLEDALSPLRHIRGWAVVPLADIEPGEEVHGRIRLRLNTSLLARPFQIDALNSSAWSFATPWKDFSFSISVGGPRQ